MQDVSGIIRYPVMMLYYVIDKAKGGGAKKMLMT